MTTIIDVTIPPAVEPVSLADMRAQLRVDEFDAAQDAQLAARIAAARLYVEKAAGRALITQTLRQTLDAFPPAGESIVLLRTPAVAVVSVTYHDGEGTIRTMESTDYVATLGEGTSRVGLPGGRWPATRRQPGAVAVSYIAGYGATPASVPADLVAAVKLLAQTFHLAGDDADVPRAVERLIQINRTALSW